MMKKLIGMIAAVCLLLGSSAYAAIIDVDLSGASTGTSIDGNGADFASLFAGQSLSGPIGISGSPSGPLTLQAANTLDVAYWAPGVSPASNSILPEPGNQGPLSVLLESVADSITWTMGYANPPSTVDIDFFDGAGNLVHSVTQDLIEGYNVYSYSGFGAFSGLSIYNNVDGAGLRFQNFSYETASVPEPATLALLGLGLFGIGIRRRIKI